MGAYYRDEYGYWECRFTMNYPDGTSKRFRRKAPRNTKRAAEQFEREFRDELLQKWHAEKHGLTLEDAPTLAAFKPEFMSWAKANVKKSTREGYESVLRTGLIPQMGELKLDEINARHIERYKATKDVSAKTMRNHLGVLSKLLHLAKRYEYVARVPEFDPPKVGRSKVESLEFWTFEEADRVLAKVDTEPRIANIVRLGLATGLRMGELCGLQWGDVDLVARTLAVRRAHNRRGTTTPKSNKHRRVPLQQAAVDALQAQKASTYLRAAPDADWVFCDEEGLFTYNRIKDGYWRVVRAAEVTEISFHGLRHTFASHCVMRGVPLEVLQKWLGHSDIRQTQRYAHLAKSHTDQFVELLDAPQPHRGPHTDQNS